MRFLAPLLIALVAVLGATLAEALLTTALLIQPLAYWLMKHDTVQLVLVFAQFGAVFLSSAAAVRAVTRLVLRRRRFPLPWAVEHLVQAILLYAVFLGSLMLHIRCAHNCEGLMLGAIKLYILLALGGIVANAWELRRARTGAPAF